ncbi:uncharacterized protein LOC133914413 [Phragmites australis]|uniref:uncharacterized protein LOC133914413 n=1 Tax=Phragmites australis TaxID=29695 RepID=UPI002D798369|nr:uncharacterized protein LOC133914413 [Phragmites australis]
MAFSASVVHVSFLAAVLVLFAATAAGANATVATNTTVTAGRSSTMALPASAAAPNDSLQYICYLCRKRNTLMMTWCPIEKDECHIACLSLPSPSSPPRPRAVAAPGDGNGNRGDDDCYVMKLYPDGSWVVVDVVSCQAAAGCYLVCSYGDAREDGAWTTPATPREPLPHRLADFERCGDQLVAPGAAVPGV